MTSFKDFSEQYLPKINSSLQSIFADFLEEPVFLMMDYALKTPGKRLRPLITLAVIDGFDVEIDDQLIEVANAIELVHTYSLVHDDLPAMDNDDLRRNQPTVHKKYTEADAILAGDALLTHAFLLLADNSLPSEIRIELVRSLSVAAGPFNMVAGQQHDVSGDDQLNQLENLTFNYHRKTASLFTYAAASGAILAEQNQEVINAFNKFAVNFGIAYQIKDDILDVLQTSDQDKITYPKLIGLDDSKQKLTEYVETSKQSISQIEKFNPEVLYDLIDSLVQY